MCLDNRSPGVSSNAQMVDPVFRQVLREVVRGGKVAASVVESYDAFMKVELPAILRSTPVVKLQNGLEEWRVVFRFFSFSQPKEVPNFFRKNGGYYETTVYVTLHFISADGEVIKSEPINLCNLPIMLGSSLDVCTQMTPRQRQEAGENPDDPGGYFIIEGKERILMMEENSKPRYPGLFIRQHDKGDRQVPTITYTSGENFSGINSRVLTLSYDEKEGFQIFMSIGMDKKNLINMGHLYYIIIRAILEYSYAHLDNKRQRLNSLRSKSNPTTRDRNEIRDLSFHVPQFELIYSELKDVLDSKESLTRFIIEDVSRFLPNTDSSSHKQMIAAVLKTMESNYIHGEAYERIRMNIKSQTDQSDEQISFYIVDEIFKNVPTKSMNYPVHVKEKMRTLSYMVSKFSQYLAGDREIESMDDWAYKKFNTAGEHMRSHFAGSMIAFIEAIEKNATAMDSFDKLQAAVRSNEDITSSFMSSFRGSVWGAKKSGAGVKKTTVTDTIVRHNLISLYSHKSRIRTPGSNMTANEKRQVMNTQYGYCCPVTTPDGETCGLVKDHTITTRISVAEANDNVLSFIVRHKQKYGESLFFTETENKGKVQFKQLQDYSTVFLNGIVVGFTRGDGTDLVTLLQRARRLGVISKYTELVKTEYKEVFIYTDPGRMVRPLLVVNKDEFRHEIDIQEAWNRSFDELVDKGCIEYIGIFEGKYKYILPRPEELSSMREAITEARDFITYLYEGKEVEDPVRQFHKLSLVGIPEELHEDYLRVKKKLVTYMNSTIPDYTEISPEAILAISPAVIPFLSMSPGARLTYQGNMGKQALGLDITNTEASERVSTSVTYALKSPDIPIAYTDVGTAVGLDKYPVGQHVICAFMPFGGANEEDAIILDQKAVDRGLFRVKLYYGYVDYRQITGTTRETYGIPPGKENNPQFAHIHRSGENEGLPEIGAKLKIADCVIAKYTKTPDGRIIDRSVYTDYSESGVVEYASMQYNGSNSVVSARVRIVDERNVQVGDKLSSRYAQKGVVGQIIPHDQMPRIHAPGNKLLHGVVPSVLFNSLGIPSRMTIGKLVEMGVGLVGASEGRRYNSSPFDASSPIENAMNLLESKGLPRSGKLQMLSMQTGEIMTEPIFVGIMYYQILKHFAHKKVRGVGQYGPVDSVLRQPRKGSLVRNGIVSYGAIRAGHMEQTAFKGYGLSNVLLDRLMFSSDLFRTGFCACGNQLIIDRRDGAVTCRLCSREGRKSKPALVDISFSMNLFRQYCQAMGTNMKLIPYFPNKSNANDISLEEYKSKNL